MYKKICTLIIASLMILTVAICGCTESTGGTTESNEEITTITVVDAAGRTVEVPKNPGKIIALSCALREVVYLQSQEKVVGIEYREASKEIDGTFPSGLELPYLAAYPELMDLPVVNSGNSVNFEEIAILNPDVIFVGTSGAANADNIQTKSGIPVVVVYVATVGTDVQNEKYYETLRIMGEVLGKEERSEELISIINEYEKDLAMRTENIPEDEKPTVYVAGRPYCGVHGLDGTDPHWPSFELINANNVASEVSDVSEGITINKEQLIEWDPEYIFVSEASINLINEDLKDPAYQGLNAVQNGNIYGVPPYCWYSFNKGTGIANAYFVGKTVYSEQFSDINVEEKTDEIYEKFLGKPVYSVMASQFGGYTKLNLN
ncbi:iron complex transport system substrate-binding protein [Methanococcus maripaludis]|uniref:Iron complex transport system substrate-binding protein n=1 Tax=Methanococcus maripaludis TaxID=39152 RepID=A0A7J9NZD5_METMI|nr:iron ABC transporter substrate-binding protein [Methanococcus maripaludis]MBA2852614.1 iron complex transport system substrate-binding protein [Methanococcus maripaludis]